MTDSNDKIRLDKWLWAARFFKTRALAKDAIEGGKVHYEGQRCKVSKSPEIGAKLTIRQGFDEKIVIIKALSGQRRGAAEAQLLYEETPQSRVRRYGRGRSARRVVRSRDRPSRCIPRHAWESSDR